MASLGVKYTVAALTFAVGLGVNIEFDQVGQRTSGSWLGAGLALSGAQARGHGGGHHGGDHHHDGHDHHHHDDHDHYHHGNRAAWRALRTAAFLATLPRGCPLVGLYYYCGGVYYQSTVQNGSTVYVVVTP